MPKRQCCSCLGTCKGKVGLSAGYYCALDREAPENAEVFGKPTPPGSGGSAPAPAPTADEDAAWLDELAVWFRDPSLYGVQMNRLRAIAARLAQQAERLDLAERMHDQETQVRQFAEARAESAEAALATRTAEGEAPRRRAGGGKSK